MNSKLLIGVVSITGAVLAGLFIIWFLFFRAAPALQTTTQTETGLGSGTTKSVGTSGSTDTTNNAQPLTGTQASKQKVFKIADGPVTSATFIQTLYPTTTYARYILQENGHVLDFPLDTPGALPRATSNTTIPGTARAVWSKQGGSTFMQYMDSGIIKTVSLIFPVATSSRQTVGTIQIQFFPNNVSDLAVAPDGTQVAYLLPNNAGGVDGYLSKPDATASKKLFTLALSEVLISWPSTNTILLQTKSNASSPGVVFSVDVKTGNIIPLLYSPGLTATADRSFTNIVYQTSADGDSRSSYVHNTKTNKDSALSFDPIPEKCVWSTVATSTMYCAMPLTYIPSTYLDLWHLGAATAVDSIVSFTMGSLNSTEYVADPGSADGGVASDILELAVSPDDKYLLFIKKGDRSLWGVRITQ
jgi:hypothetical protein